MIEVERGDPGSARIRVEDVGIPSVIIMLISR